MYIYIYIYLKKSHQPILLRKHVTADMAVPDHGEHCEPPPEPKSKQDDVPGQGQMFCGGGWDTDKDKHIHKCKYIYIYIQKKRLLVMKNANIQKYVIRLISFRIWQVVKLNLS